MQSFVLHTVCIQNYKNAVQFSLNLNLSQSTGVFRFREYVENLQGGPISWFYFLGFKSTNNKMAKTLEERGIASFRSHSGKLNEERTMTLNMLKCSNFFGPVPVTMGE